MGKIPEKYGKLTGEEGPGLPRTPTATPLRAATGEVTGMQIATAQRRLGAEYGYLEQRRGVVRETTEAEQFNREVEQYNRNKAAFGGMATLYNIQEQEKFNKQLEDAGYTYSPAPLPYTPIGGGYGFAPVAIKTEPLYTPKEGGFASMISGETALIQYGTQEEIGKASFEEPTTYFAKFGLLPEGIKYAVTRKTPEGGKTYELYQEQEGKDVLVGYKEFGAIRPQAGKQTLQESIRANVYDIGAKVEAADPLKAFLDKGFDYAIYTQKNELLRGGLQGTKGFFSFFTPSFQVQTFAAMAGTGAIIGADFLAGDYKTTATGFKRGTEETIKMFVVPEQFVGTVAAGAGFLSLGALAPAAKGTAARYARVAEPEILLTPKSARPNIYEGRLGEKGRGHLE
jgi:hypothetical protein